MVRKRLGRGIGALIPEEEPEPGGMAMIPVSEIHPNPDQPRKEFDARHMHELQQSIARSGVVQPVTVRKTEDEFELVVGERRWRAAKEVNLDKIPAYILDVETDVEMLEFALIENVQRQDLNPIELAHAYNALVEQHGLSQEEVANRVSKSRSAVANYIRLLNLPSFVQQSLKDGRLTAGHARALLAVEDEDRLREIWEKILDESLSVRVVEQLVSEPEKSSAKEPSRRSVSSGGPSKSPHLMELEERLQHKLGTKVQIRHRGNGGKIEISYYSDEDFERLLEMLESAGLE